MNLLLATLKKILFWSYDRGTWQYDILCVLILAFIFLSPNGLFKIKNSKLASDTVVSDTRSAQSDRTQPDWAPLDRSDLQIQSSADRTGKAVETKTNK